MTLNCIFLTARCAYLLSGGIRLSLLPIEFEQSRWTVSFVLRFPDSDTRTLSGVWFASTFPRRSFAFVSSLQALRQSRVFYSEDQFVSVFLYGYF